MNNFNEVFFVGLIGVIVSLVSFLVPLTYRYLREAAKELGEWKAKGLYRDGDTIEYVLSVIHYYFFADAVIDIIAVAGAFSIFGNIYVMSVILVPKIGSCANLPLFKLVTKHDYFIYGFLFFFYLLLILIALYGRYRYLKHIKDNFDKNIKIKLLLPGIIYFLVFAILGTAPIFLFIRYIFDYAAFIYLGYLIIAIVMYVIAIWKVRIKKINKSNPVRNFLSGAKMLFFVGLFMLVSCASLHFLYLLGALRTFGWYGVIIVNIILVVSLFLFWFSLGPLFLPNTALTFIYEKISNTNSRQQGSPSRKINLRNQIIKLLRRSAGKRR